MSLLPLALAVEVVLWHPYRAAEERALEHAARVYSALHPEVRVETVGVPFDAYSYKLEAAIPRGNGPDLFVGKHDAIGEWSRSGLIEALPPGPAGELEAFLEGTVAPLRLGGKLWGLPLAFKSLALFYRRDLLAEPPATTDELMAVSRRLTDGHGRYGLAYEAGSFFCHAPWLHGFGGRILDESGQPHLADPPAVASLEFLNVLVRERLLPEETSATVATQLFNDGRAAMTINGPWFVGEIAPGVPYAVAPLPRVSSTGLPAAPFVNMEAIMLAARARAPKEAIEFARWLAGPEGALLRAREGRQTVAATRAWDDPQVKADPLLTAFRAQLAETVPMSNRLEMRSVWEPAQRALRRVLRGTAEPRAALAEAERQIREALRPPPPPVPPLPYEVGLLGLGLAGAFWLWRRARAPGGLAELRRSRFAYAYLLPAATAMGVLVFVPFAVSAGMSLTHYDAGHFSFVGFTNFVDILASREGPIWAPLSFYFTLVVTALWTVANVALHVTLGVSLALLLRAPLGRLRGLYRMLLIVPWAMPNYITALIWKGMFHRQFGAVNGILVALGLEPVSWFSRFWTAFTANLTTNVWLGFPFMMVVTLGALSRIPRELEEAAALDGATRWQRLHQVVLPLVRPAIWPSVILGAVWTFNMFNIIFLVSGGEPDGATEILISQAYRWAFTRGHRYGYAAAYAVLIFVVLVAQSLLSGRATELEPA